jgi:hypothetical protein
MLIKQARSFERVYIFVDALDRVERKLVFGLLRALEYIQSIAENMSIMVSSPEILDYRNRLPHAKIHKVRANAKELALFVHRRIARSGPSMMYKMVQEDKELELEIQEIVEEKASRMCVSQIVHAMRSLTSTGF